MSDNIEEIKKKYLKDLYDDYRYSINKFDTYTVYLSGGALAISLAFVENIVPIEEAVCIYLYYGAIIFFGFTMLFGIIAHHISAIEIDKRIKEIEEGLFDEIEKEIKKDNDDNKDKDKKMKKDKICIMNEILAYSITIGTILLIIFAIINMNALNNKSNQTQQNSIIYEHPENTVSIIEIE